MRRLLAQIEQQLQQLDQQLALSVTARSPNPHAMMKRAKRLQAVAGVGVITADAVCASVGNAHDFKNGRQFAAWIGLTPRQYSSGGKTQLGRISRRGDAYLRSLLVQGARSTLQAALKKAPDKLNRMQQWITSSVWTGGISQDTGRHRQQTCPATVGHAGQRERPMT